MTEPTETNTPPPAEPAGRSKLGLVAIIAAVLIGGVVLFLGMRNSATDRPDDVAPDFEMYFFDGYEWQSEPTAELSDFAGQPVVLNFWASWCVECKVEADLLEDTWQKYHAVVTVFLPRIFQ